MNPISLMTMKSIILFAGLALTISVGSAAPVTTAPAYAERIPQIAAHLPASPAGPGRPITDRAFWAEVAKDPNFAKQIEGARAAAAIKPEPIPDELYLQFSQNGNRKNYENEAFKKRGRLQPLVLAECIENKGEFLPAINALLLSLCEEKTWVLPAHDKELTNFKNSLVTIDLFSSALAWQLAMADYLLGDKLNPDVRKIMRREIYRRTLEPFQEMIRGQRKSDYWLKQHNNWNPVCLSGVTGAALIMMPDANDRAEAMAAAEYYSRYFLEGFTSDGYCSEGVGYWNYGYGMYTVMGLNFRHVTGGWLDLFTLKGAAEPAAYGVRIPIVNGICPAFADCNVGARPYITLQAQLNRIYGWNRPEFAAVDTAGSVRALSEAMVLQDFLREKITPIPGAKLAQGEQLRTEFPKAGIFLCRQSGGDRPDAFAVALKGGNNAEQHNHNDLGSFVVVAGRSEVLLDPGPEVYTRRTFSKDRYQSKLLNSYGHSVPVVAGKLQRTGKEAVAKILKKDFTATTDTVTFDLTSAYDVKSLKKLTRTFEYGRDNGGILIITDEVVFSKPETFETALISRGEFTGNNGRFTVKEKSEAQVQMLPSAEAIYEVTKIEENAGTKPNRLAARLKHPVLSAKVVTAVRPHN